MKLHLLKPTFVTYVPRDLADGRIYISMEYATAVHLCACGCGTKTVTPLSRGGWTLTFDGAVTLRPSIGNGQSLCRSHYLLTGGTVDWLPPIGAAATRSAVARDRRLAASVGVVPRGTGWWSGLVTVVRHWLHLGGSRE